VTIVSIIFPYHIVLMYQLIHAYKKSNVT